MIFMFLSLCSVHSTLDTRPLGDKDWSVHFRWIKSDDSLSRRTIDQRVVHLSSRIRSVNSKGEIFAWLNS